MKRKQRKNVFEVVSLVEREEYMTADDSSRAFEPHRMTGGNSTIGLHCLMEGLSTLGPHRAMENGRALTEEGLTGEDIELIRELYRK